VASAVGQGRILDNDTRNRLATVDSRVCLIDSDPIRSTPDPAPTRSSSPDPTPTPSPTQDSVGSCTIEPGNIVIAPIILNIPNPTAQSLLFETSDGDLLANLDYVPVRRFVVIPAGVMYAFVQITLLPHAFTQSGGHFNTHISHYTGGGQVIAGNGQITVCA
jgi:hypothetical protein